MIIIIIYINDTWPIELGTGIPLLTSTALEP